MGNGKHRYMSRTCWAPCHDIILYLPTSTIRVTWTIKLVLLGQCVHGHITTISPRQMVLIHPCQLQQPPNSTFITTTYKAVRHLSRKPPTVPPSLYVSFTNNLQLFISHLLTYTFCCQLLQDTTTVSHCVSCYLHSLSFCFAVVFSQVFFLSSHTVIYVSVWFLV